MAINPISEMALEPVSPSTSDGAAGADGNDMSRRFWIGLALSIPVFILAMREASGARYFEESRFEGNYLIQLLLTTAVVFWAGRPILEKARQSVILKAPDMFTLIGMGLMAEYVFSVASFALAPRISRHTIEPIPIYFDCADVITLLALFGQLLESRARRYAAGARSDAALTQRVEMVASDRRHPAPIKRKADAVSAWLVPTVIGVAVLALALWLWLGRSPSLKDAPEKAAGRALANAVAVLVVASPCALGLAASMSILAGVGRAAREGVQFRDGEALETLASVDTLVLADSVNSTAIRRLQEMGLKVVLLKDSDDRTATDAATPDRRAEEVRQLRNSGRIVAMVGDNLIDSQAMAAANVGISKSKGLEPEIEGAGVILVDGGFEKVIKAIEIGRKTMQNICQTTIFAIAYNAIAIPIAAGLLHPFFGILLNPMLAITLMTLSSIAVMLNALRLQRQ